MLKWFSKRQTSESAVNHQNSEKNKLVNIPSSSELTDADYDFLFNQLLDGVAHGWNQFKVIKFFQNLGVRGQEDHWAAWLEKFATKIPDTPNDSQRRLGAIMLRLAEVTQSASELSRLSAVSSVIGKKLFFGKANNLVWEYDGVDIVNSADLKNSIEDSSSAAKIDNSVEESQAAILDSASSSGEVEKSEPQKALSNNQLEEPIEILQSSEETKVENVDSQNIESAELEETLNSAVESHSAVDIATESDALKEKEAVNSQSEISQSGPTEFSAATDSSNTATIELVESWFNLGLKQANTGDLPGAINSWHEALKLNPNLAEIWHNLGSALGRLEHYPEAIDSFNHALEIEPRSEYAWNDRAHAFFQMQQWEQAIESWNQAIAINPGNHQFWYHYGNALEKLQRLDEAIASYAKALEISPDFQPAISKYSNLIKES